MEKVYVGIDLGTTNSAVAVFDGEQSRVVRNKRGQLVTPSIVRSFQSVVTVGERARKYLDADPLNTHREFKRLMGTGQRTREDEEGRAWLPEELSSEVLKALIDDVAAATGIRPDSAVVTVPALFELPQNRATSEAARLAGLSKVELLPEPVASAFAAGWTQDSAGESWLIFDLGGGTFDVSLVEARDGLLRVIGHDGDNFLGGRDIDRLVVDWVVKQLEGRYQVSIPLDGTQRSQAARIYSEVEQAKIRLSEQEKTTIELELDELGIVEDLPFTRGELEVISAPVIDRALDISRRLLASHGLSVEGLSKVVLVGGPASMPVVRARVVADLAPLAAEDRDPMTLVAEGASLYAMSIGLGCEAATSEDKQPPNSFWMQYPNVCSELDPTIMGRLVGEGHGAPSSLQFCRDGWESERISLSDEGAFVSTLSIRPSGSTRFTIRYFDDKGLALQCQPESISIVHGMTLSDPPLSRSIGVALADGRVKSFLERGTPLPARRSFVQTTIETLIPKEQGQLNIPIVQGERAKASFCRKVGNLVVRSADLKKPLLAGSRIEITLDVDRGGNMEAQALLVEQGILVKSVAELLIPSADVSVLRNMWQGVQRRVTVLQQEAFRQRDNALVRVLEKVLHNVSEIGVQLAGPMEDEDARQRLYRNLMEIDADVEEIEMRGQVEELKESCEDVYMNAMSVVAFWGSETDKTLMRDLEPKFRSALERGRVPELERMIEQLERIYFLAYRKSPDYWAESFEEAASRAHEAKDVKRARKLVEKGRRLLESGEQAELRGVAQALWSLLPASARPGEETHDSGIF